MSVGTNYILIDKAFLPEVNAYVMYLYDQHNGVIKKVTAPVTKSIDMTNGGYQSAVQSVK